MTTTILSLVNLTADRKAALSATGYAVIELAKHGSREDAVRAGGESVKAVLTNGRGGISAAEMALLPGLEIVHAVSAGYEAVDLEAARARGIAVTYSPDTNAPAVADSAMMLLMAASRHLREADRFVHEGGWQDQWKVDTPTISSKRLGIVGLGKIGARIAHRAARGFDMEVGYHNRSRVADSPYRYFESVVELAKWAQFLVCATPGGAGTKHLVNAEVLAALGPKGYLVNVGRGTVVDTAALIKAVEAKQIAGAGLDVLEGEPAFPQISAELLRFPNVIVTPHVAGKAPDSEVAATALTIENLGAHFAGKPLTTPVPG